MACLRCPACGAEEPETSARWRCPCGELFDAAHDFPALDRGRFDARLVSTDSLFASGVWRFRELVWPGFPGQQVVSLREGATPLHRSAAVARFAGLGEILLKHEGQNPTGSFKDRGMTVAVSRARFRGARLVACASTGNTAASLAAYAAAAGLACAVVAPEGGVAPAKLAQALAHGARVVLVRGSFDRALELLRGVAERGEAALLNSVDPFRIEGQKTIVLELFQQLGWEVPDWVVFPAGNLGNCAAFGKAIREALQLGLIARAPRLAAVQADGAAPFARAFERGFERLEPVEARTVASAIRIGNPASFARAARAIRETRGEVLSVPDEGILAAKAALDRSGIGCEPASAASVAGARELARRGTIRPGERVACVLTAHLLKDPEAGLDPAQLERAGRVRTVEPSAEALAGALDLRRED